MRKRGGGASLLKVAKQPTSPPLKKSPRVRNSMMVMPSPSLMAVNNSPSINDNTSVTKHDKLINLRPVEEDGSGPSTPTKKRASVHSFKVNSIDVSPVKTGKMKLSAPNSKE